ncbi:hypothetical protein J1N35_018459 [Gossypium stocksii]|uniref:Uncharacterized protein n=1 Tax=Gossypium stocksii TaxID=47602 RepID=A0A9D3VPZ6_9ROSI|nr:hypothetical protein J1N35_018459 [Gossypium stocksii]
MAKVLVSTLKISMKARDPLYKDYQPDQKFTLITSSPTGVVVTSARTKKGDLFLVDVNTQLKFRNVTIDIKVDTSSNVIHYVYQLFTTIIVDELAPVLNAIFGFRVPDQRSDKYIGISSSIGLTVNPIVNFSGVLGTNNEKGDSFNTSYYHIVNPSTNTDVGAEVTHSFSTNVNIITVGTQHALDPLTTIKAQVNNAGNTSTLIEHEWHSKSLFTISGDVDTESIDKSLKVGLALTLKP